MIDLSVRAQRRGPFWLARVVILARTPSLDDQPGSPSIRLTRRGAVTAAVRKYLATHKLDPQTRWHVGG